MKIVFLTQDDPLYILPFFEEFFRLGEGKIEVASLFACKTMGERGRLRLLRELLLLYRPMGLARLIARRAKCALLCRLRASRDSGRFYSLAQLCRAYDVPYRTAGNPNRDEYQRQMTALAPDLLVSIACPYILKTKLLEMPPLGCINLHHAPLPRYKGMMPTFWQMYHGEKEVGLTIHYMAAKLDEGEVILQEKLPIDEDESLDHLIRRTKRHAALCMAKAIRDIEQSRQERFPLDAAQSSYFTFPTASEMKEFRRRGLRAI